MELIYRTGYGNIPIYEKDVLIGIVNGRKLINVLGKKVGEGIDLQNFITNTEVKDIVEEMGDDYYFMLADKNITIEAAMNFFENNRKLLVILITKDGKDNSKPLSIISSADIVDMKKILDVY